MFFAVTEDLRHTADVGGESKTGEVVDAVLARIGDEMNKRGTRLSRG